MTRATYVTDPDDREPITLRPNPDNPDLAVFLSLEDAEAIANDLLDAVEGFRNMCHRGEQAEIDSN